LEASQQFSFYRLGLLAPRPTPIPEDQASVLFISPRGRMATHKFTVNKIPYMGPYCTRYVSRQRARAHNLRRSEKISVVIYKVYVFLEEL
jgi:hypothetical protein